MNNRIITTLFFLITALISYQSYAQTTPTSELNNNDGVSASKIRYSIAKATGVRITVFDILAREVKTIVNEYLQAGAYETDLSAAGLTHGTYYYKIQTGDYTQVKKIVLN